MRRLAALLVIPALIIPSVHAAAPAAPAALSGLSLWFNASRSAVAVNAPEGRWVENLSGAEDERTATAPAAIMAGKRSAFNGLPAVSFNALGPFFKADLDIRSSTAPDVTIIALYYYDPIGIAGVFGDDDGNWDRFFLAEYGGQSPCVSNSAEVIEPFCLKLTGERAAGVHAVAIRYSKSGPSSIFFDGIANLRTFTDNSSPSFAKRSFIIGADGDGNPMVGQIAEVMVYKRGLSNNEIERLFKYLSVKYGLSI